MAEYIDPVDTLLMMILRVVTLVAVKVPPTIKSLATVTSVNEIFAEEKLVVRILTAVILVVSILAEVTEPPLPRSGSPNCIAPKVLY